MPLPQRVRCSPLRRRERVADVVGVDVRPSGQLIYSVEVDGHRYRVDANDTEPV